MAPRLITFIDDMEDSSWHPVTKKLLILRSVNLYQFDKGKFRLVRVVPKGAELTNEGILCSKRESGLSFLPYKSPLQQKSLILPSARDEMKRLQDESFERFYRDGFESDVDPSIRDFRTNCQTVKTVVESPDYLLVYVNVCYSQSASQRVESDNWREFGGTIYTRQLLKYSLNQKEYEILDGK